MQGLAWMLQLAALVIVGSALLMGLVYGSMRAELTMLAIGAGVFLFGRWLGQRQG